MRFYFVVVYMVYLEKIFRRTCTRIFMKHYFQVIFVIVLFIVINFFALKYESLIIDYSRSTGSFGMIVYVVTTALAIIIPVWANVVLIPIATVMWGPFITALLSIVGWVIGSQVSFVLGRLFEKRIVNMFPSLGKSNYVEKLVSKRHQFLSLIFLRMTVPVDILSYGLGIFVTRVGGYQNFVTTFIGVIPFAFIFSYSTVIHFQYSLILFGVTTTLFVIYSIYVANKEY